MAKMNRTRAQRRYVRMGYTHETATLDRGTFFLIQPHESWRECRDRWDGLHVRPVAKHHIHNGRKP